MSDVSVERFRKRPVLDLTWDDYRWPLYFLLSLAMMGLMFPLGFVLVPVILINRFRHNRYDFLIMLTILFGGFGFWSANQFPVKMSDIALAVSVVGLFIMRKTPIMRKTVMLILVYALALFVFAMLSEESLLIQIRMLRNYLYLVYFIVPFMVFAGQDFDIEVFIRRVAVYVLVICCFYLFDCVTGVWLLIPNLPNWAHEESRFYDLLYRGLFSFPRQYPHGLYIIALLVFGIVRTFRLTKMQWTLIILALISTRTFTFITGVFLVYIICMPDVKKKVRYAVVLLLTMVLTYFIDGMMPLKANGESELRVASSIDQLFKASNIQDEEDLAELGSGRMAQILPKVELVNQLGKQATGLGFLHEELTTNQKFIIVNDLYVDVERSIEVATAVEVEPLNVYLMIGYIGLAVHLLFLFMTYWYVRRTRYSLYYLSVLIALFWFGLSGFAPLNSFDGLMLLSVAYSAVILNDRRNELSD